ncbi:hypothetical protein [Francisella halioticida]|nr:hypothetical protein [Francisella halioticida]
MKLQKISNSCYAIINEKNRMCDANFGFINLGVNKHAKMPPFRGK